MTLCWVNKCLRGRSQHLDGVLSPTEVFVPFVMSQMEANDVWDRVLLFLGSSICLKRAILHSTWPLNPPQVNDQTNNKKSNAPCRLSYFSHPRAGKLAQEANASVEEPTAPIWRQAPFSSCTSAVDHIAGSPSGREKLLLGEERCLNFLFWARALEERRCLHFVDSAVAGKAAQHLQRYGGGPPETKQGQLRRTEARVTASM